MPLLPDLRARLLAGEEPTLADIRAAVDYQLALRQKALDEKAKAVAVALEPPEELEDSTDPANFSLRTYPIIPSKPKPKPKPKPKAETEAPTSLPQINLLDLLRGLKP